MHYIFLFIFRGPWVIQLVVGGLIAWGGLHLHRDNAELLAAQMALSEAPPPPVTEIAAFVAKREGQRVVEARVLAQIDFDATTLLVKKTNGITTSEELMYVLLDSNAPQDSRKARAVMLVDPDREQEFKDWVLAHAVGLGDRGVIVQVEGLVSSSGSSLVGEALEDRGFGRSGPDFYIAPFLDGREAGLKALPNGRGGFVWGIFAAAAAMILLGMVKLARWGVRRGQPKEARAMSGRPVVAAQTGVAAEIGAAAKIGAPGQIGAVPQVAQAEEGDPIAARAAAMATAMLAAQAAEAAAAQEASARQAKLRRRTIGGVVALVGLVLWASGYLGVALPLVALLVVYLGWRSLTRSISRGIGVAAVSGLDRLTGIQAARDRAEVSAVQAGPRSLEQGALIESRASGAVQGKVALLRWAPFALGVVLVVGMAAFQGGSEGLRRLGHDLLAPLTGASPAMMQVGGGAKVSAPVEPAPVAKAMPDREAAASQPGLAHMVPLGGVPHSLGMVGLLLLLAFAASYVQRWYIHRNALPLDDPWERLDERLRLRRQG